MNRAATSKLPLLPLLMLASTTFMSVTIEMLPTGLMHLMSTDLGVTDAQIGLLMSIFAITVVTTSTTLMVVFRDVPKRLLLVAVLIVFALGTIGTALATTYTLVLVTRILTGLAHGLFWATVTSYTASLVEHEQLTRAVAITSGGGSLAFVLGVPLGTALGQWFGWRTTFIVLAACCLIVALGLWLILPKPSHEPPPNTSPIEIQPAPQALSDLDELVDDAAGHGSEPAPSMRRVALVCIICAITMTGQYTFYSYVSPFLLGAVGLGEDWLPMVLFGYGVTAGLATFLTGTLFSGRFKLGFYVTAACMLLGGGALAVFTGLLPVAMAGTLLWGAGMGFMPVLLQARLLAVAPPERRDFASALYTSGFNLGIATGSAFGGALLDDFGLGALGPAFLILIGLAVVISIVVDAGRLRKRPARTV